MNRRSTAKDVARLSGVSSATVSYVLNNVQGQTIPPATRERVRAAAAELSYVPSAAAASLRRGHSRLVVVVTDLALAGYVTEPFLRAISERLVEDELVPIVYRMASDEALLALVDEIRPYGVLAPLPIASSVLSTLEAYGVPRVYASGRSDTGFRRPWEEQIGELQARHMSERGVTHLIYAHPAESNPRIVMSRARELGAQRAFAELQAAREPASTGPRRRRQVRSSEPASNDLRSVNLSRDREQAAATLATALGEHRGSVGICAFDDEVAAVAVAAVRDLGWQVPTDVKVIGVDDNPFSAFLEPPLTTVAIDARASGRSLTERFLGVAAVADSSQSGAMNAHVVLRATS
jgi:DNA-binding LacI/PurR family transcriptional regulator